MMRIEQDVKRKLEVLRDTHGFDSLNDALDYILKESKAIRDRMINWLAEIVPGGNIVKYVKIEDDPKSDRYKFRLYTEKYNYAIHVKRDGTYMGALLGCQFRYPGEDWLRGSDFPDGTFSLETWNRIKNRIIESQLQPLSRETLSRLELQNIHTGDEEAVELAEKRREQEVRFSECGDQTEKELQ